MSKQQQAGENDALTAEEFEALFFKIFEEGMRLGIAFPVMPNNKIVGQYFESKLKAMYEDLGMTSPDRTGVGKKLYDDLYKGEIEESQRPTYKAEDLNFPLLTPAPQDTETGETSDPFIQKHLAIIMEKTRECMIEMHIQQNREFLRPSIQNFLEGGNVNGQFRIAVMKMMNKTVAISAIHCQCKPDDKHGTTGIDCCNHCGLPDESWWRNGPIAPPKVDTGRNSKHLDAGEIEDMLMFFVEQGLCGQGDGSDHKDDDETSRNIEASKRVSKALEILIEGVPVRDTKTIEAKAKKWKPGIREHTLMFLAYINDNYSKITSNGYRAKCDANDRMARMYTDSELYADYSQTEEAIESLAGHSEAEKEAVTLEVFNYEHKLRKYWEDKARELQYTINHPESVQSSSAPQAVEAKAKKFADSLGWNDEGTAENVDVRRAYLAGHTEGEKGAVAFAEKVVLWLGNTTKVLNEWMRYKLTAPQVIARFQEHLKQ